MSIPISYMGTKRQIANVVTPIIRAAKGGAFLDVFAGMCTVAAQVGATRQVWTNDLQAFSTCVGSTLFCSKDAPINAHDLAFKCFPTFQEARVKLYLEFKDELAYEDRNVLSEEISRLAAGMHAQIAKAQERASQPQDRNKYDLFSNYYAGTYFSLRQCIDADCIRKVADDLSFSSIISPDERRWALVALGIALSKVTTSTGHFAQPLEPKQQNARRYISQRKRSLWQEWLLIHSLLHPVGGKSWRRRNRTYQSDALELLEKISREGRSRPAVIYADPPYTRDQYSRYYHLLETAILYDYPSADGRGQYRNDRTISEFSLASKVESAITELISRCANLDSALVLSYPKNGLLKDSAKIIPQLIKSSYGKAPLVTEIKHHHSTMGASSGPYRTEVTERLYSVKCQP